MATDRELTATVPVRSAPKRRSLGRLLTRNMRSVIGALVLVLIFASAIFADWLAPYPPNRQNLRNRLQPPSAEHILGTDNFGRDVLSRIIHGGRVSLSIGFISVGIALAIGGLMGLLAGFYGGTLDSVISGIVDVLLALPAFLLALAIVAALGPSIVNVMIAVGIANIPSFARIVRSAVLTVREMEYVAAAHAIGSRDGRVMARHVIPNALGPVIVQVSLSLAGAILAAAGLSFLGMGAQPPTAEWGSMLNAARPYIRDAQWTVTFPGLAIVVTVLALNLVGDGLRDALDPRRLQAE
ncbi:MAG: ABC transporter permease [Deinococcales bacterium]|nr:ABC transporter permease [Deinococcales bacterium]